MNSTLLNVPVGTVIDYAGNTIPSGYLECNGQAVSRTTYKALFSAIGTLWGAGDGSTTFNLPNLNGRTTIGVSGTAHAMATTGGNEATSYTPKGSVDNHTLTISEMPSHAHELYMWVASRTAVSDAFGNAVAYGGSVNGVGWQDSTTVGKANHTGMYANAMGTKGKTGGGGAHKHGFSGTADNISIMQPFATVRKLVKF